MSKDTAAMRELNEWSSLLRVYQPGMLIPFSHWMMSGFAEYFHPLLTFNLSYNCISQSIYPSRARSMRVIRHRRRKTCSPTRPCWPGHLIQAGPTRLCCTHILLYFSNPWCRPYLGIVIVPASSGSSFHTTLCMNMLPLRFLLSLYPQILNLWSLFLISLPWGSGGGRHCVFTLSITLFILIRLY